MLRLCAVKVSSKLHGGNALRYSQCKDGSDVPNNNLIVHKNRFNFVHDIMALSEKVASRN